MADKKKIRKAMRLKAAAEFGKKIKNKEIPKVSLKRAFDEEKGKAVIKPELTGGSIKIPKSENAERLKNKAVAEIRNKIDRELAENEEDNLGTEALRKTANFSKEVTDNAKKNLPDEKLIKEKTAEALKRQKAKLLKEKRWKEFKKENIPKTKEATKKATKETAKEGTRKVSKETVKGVAKEEIKTLPKTGKNAINISFGIFILLLISYYFYKKYKYLKNI